MHSSSWCATHLLLRCWARRDKLVCRLYVCWSSLLGWLLHNAHSGNRQIFHCGHPRQPLPVRSVTAKLRVDWRRGKDGGMEVMAESVSWLRRCRGSHAGSRGVQSVSGLIQCDLDTCYELLSQSLPVSDDDISALRVPGLMIAVASSFWSRIEPNGWLLMTFWWRGKNSGCWGPIHDAPLPLRITKITSRHCSLSHSHINRDIPMYHTQQTWDIAHIMVLGIRWDLIFVVTQVGSTLGIIRGGSITTNLQGWFMFAANVIHVYLLYY